MEALFLLVTQFAMGAQHDLQMAGQILLAEQFGYALHALAFFARNLQQRRILARNLSDGGIAEESHHLPGEMRGAMTFADQMIHLAENVFAGAARYGLHDVFENMRRSCAHQITDRISSNLSA